MSSAVVLLHVVNPDGTETVRLAWSDGLGWVTRRSLLKVPLDSEQTPPVPDEDDEGDEGDEGDES